MIRRKRNNEDDNTGDIGMDLGGFNIDIIDND